MYIFFKEPAFDTVDNDKKLLENIMHDFIITMVRLLCSQKTYVKWKNNCIYLIIYLFYLIRINDHLFQQEQQNED